MTNYAKLPTWADKDHVYAVVEMPRGSRAKLEFDPKLGAFTLAKPLLVGLTYPYELYPIDQSGGRRSARCSHNS
jgi:inorganic pyrophosphatase